MASVSPTKVCSPHKLNFSSLTLAWQASIIKDLKDCFWCFKIYLEATRWRTSLWALAIYTTTQEFFNTHLYRRSPPRAHTVLTTNTATSIENATLTLPKGCSFSLMDNAKKYCTTWFRGCTNAYVTTTYFGSLGHERYCSCRVRGRGMIFKPKNDVIVWTLDPSPTPHTEWWMNRSISAN